MKLLKILLFLGLMAYTCDLSAQAVYVTKTGTKYHKGSCHFLKNSKKELTLEVAQERNFTACSVCKPGTLKSKSHNSQLVQTFKSEPTPAPDKATATQCKGKTKAGSRCKRMTKDGTGRCYQHQ